MASGLRAFLRTQDAILSCELETGTAWSGFETSPQWLWESFVREMTMHSRQTSGQTLTGARQAVDF
jgi:hypothetical protein